MDCIFGICNPNKTTLIINKGETRLGDDVFRHKPKYPNMTLKFAVPIPPSVNHVQQHDSGETFN